MQLPTCHCCRELHGDTKTLLTERHSPFMSEASGRTEQSVYKKKREKEMEYLESRDEHNVRVCVWCEGQMLVMPQETGVEGDGAA